MTSYVNDELVSEGHWDSIDWAFPDMITSTHLQPGDVIGSGTVPSGRLFEPFAMDPGHFRGRLVPR
jgi:2-keto-4-pentenoate hydratase/2-oxohepta-3-ene-1,7-dioic acid hydratase in catechol pathway